MSNRRLSLFLCAGLALMWRSSLDAQVDRPPGLVSDLVDVSGDFHEYRNTYFLADKLAGFDPASGVGAITWARNQLYPRIAFNNMENVLRPFEGVTFPEGEYAVNQTLPFSIQFVSPRAVRIRIRTGPRARAEEPSPMLVREPPRDASWKMARIAGGYRYASEAGSVTILENPWHIEFRDAQGRLATNAMYARRYGESIVFEIAEPTDPKMNGHHLTDVVLSRVR